MTTLIHGKCSKPLALDLTDVFAVVSPSLSFNRNGVEFGLLQITSKPKDEIEIKYHCPSCGKKITQEDSDDIKGECLLCHSTIPLEHLNCSDALSMVCDECAEAVKAGDKSKSYLRNFAEYYGASALNRLTKLSTVIFDSISLGRSFIYD